MDLTQIKVIKNKELYLPAEKGITALLQLAGEDPARSGIVDTPQRVIKAFLEMTSGNSLEPAEILSKTFAEKFDELILLKNIEFASTCEHHLLPFIGSASVGYIPNQQNGKVVGLSKLARIVECFATRLQIQERLTKQIADALQENLDPDGIGVIIKSRHFCMICRGVKKNSAEMMTSDFRGILRESAVSRSEFLTLLNS